MGAKFSDIGKIIAQAVGSKKVLEEAANILLESIPKRTRLGKGVKDAEGPTHQLPLLKQKTKYNRKLLAKDGKLTGPGATPAKSGLNKSGDLLNNLTSVVKKGEFDIKLKDTKEESKANYLLKIDPNYSFMNVSKAEMNRVIKAMSATITEILSRIKFDSF